MEAWNKTTTAESTTGDWEKHLYILVYRCLRVGSRLLCFSHWIGFWDQIWPNVRQIDIKWLFDLDDYQYRRHPWCVLWRLFIFRSHSFETGLSRAFCWRKSIRPVSKYGLISRRSSDESCNYTDKNIAIREDRQNAVLNTEESDEH